MTQLHRYGTSDMVRYYYYYYYYRGGMVCMYGTTTIPNQIRTSKLPLSQTKVHKSKARYYWYGMVVWYGTLLSYSHGIVYHTTIVHVNVRL